MIEPTTRPRRYAAAIEVAHDLGGQESYELYLERGPTEFRDPDARLAPGQVVRLGVSSGWHHLWVETEPSRRSPVRSVEIGHGEAATFRCGQENWLMSFLGYPIRLEHPEGRALLRIVRVVSESIWNLFLGLFALAFIGTIILLNTVAFLENLEFWVPVLIFLAFLGLAAILTSTRR